MSWQEDEANVQVVGVELGVAAGVGYGAGLATAEGHGQKRVRACGESEVCMGGV